MIRAVLDTNIIVISFMRPDTPPAKLRAALDAGRFELICSPLLLAEWEDVLRRQRLQRLFGTPPAAIDEFLWGVPVSTIWIPVTPITPLVVEDPDDDIVLVTALAGQADALVSGDQHLLALKPSYHGIQILTASEFLGFLDSQGE